MHRGDVTKRTGSRGGRDSFIFVLVTLLGLLSSPVMAQTSNDRTAARKLAGEGLDLMKAGDFKAALEKFQRADELVPAPTLKIRVARCLDKLDRMQEAANVYRDIIATELKPWAPAPHQKARKDAVPELAELLEQLPSVLVTVEGPGAGDAEVTMAGTPLPPEVLAERQTLDPGVYVFTAKAGEREVREELELERGKKMRVVLVLPPVETKGPDGTTGPNGEVEDPMPFLIGSYVAFGIGGAALIAGATTGGLVLSQRGDLEDRCPNGCLPADHDDAQAFNDMRIASTAMFVVAGVGAAVGTALFLLAPDGAPDEDPPEDGKIEIEPMIGLGALGLRGSF